MAKLIHKSCLKVHIFKSCQLTALKNCTIHSTGQEKAEFWTVLGGKGPYSTDIRTAEEIQQHEPRLFQCSNATGNMKVFLLILESK